ncbi:hypothetical protein GCM10017673_42080 [Streptosporangium violaceochromogenes]|nr:hypothetical protein GCM10017673_42080 [Streptosporangium violaceochromogenes]
MPHSRQDSPDAGPKGRSPAPAARSGEVVVAVFASAMKRGLSLIFVRDHPGRGPELAPVPADLADHES